MAPLAKAAGFLVFDASSTATLLTLDNDLAGIEGVSIPR